MKKGYISVVSNEAAIQKVQSQTPYNATFVALCSVCVLCEMQKWINAEISVYNGVQGG